MHDRSTLACQLAHDGKSDDTLAAARAAGDHHGCLLVRPARPRHGVHDVVVGVPLLVKQHEHLPLLDFLGRHREELLGGSDGRTEKAVRGIRPALGSEDLREVCREVGASLAGEQAPAHVDRHGEEVGDSEIRGVVQVCRAAHRRGSVGHGDVEVNEVVDICRHLQRGVGDWPRVSGYDDEPIVVLEGVGLGPLFEFDHQVCRFAIVTDTGKNHISPLARQG